MPALLIFSKKYIIIIIEKVGDSLPLSESQKVVDKAVALSTTFL